MDRLKPLKSLNLDLNLMKNWKLWKKYFILFMALQNMTRILTTVIDSFCVCHTAFIQQVMFAKTEYPKC